MCFRNKKRCRIRHLKFLKRADILLLIKTVAYILLLTNVVACILLLTTSFFTSVTLMLAQCKSVALI